MRQELLAKNLMVISTAFIFLFLIVIIVNPGLHSTRLNKPTPEAFCEGWRLEETGELISLPATIGADAMTPIKITNAIPAAEYYNTTLLFRSSQNQVVVELGDDIIYEYGKIGDHPFIESVPSNWNLVRVPQGSKGEQIKITCTSSNANFAGVLNAVYIGSYTQCYDFIMGRHLRGFILNLLIILIGTTFCMIACFYSNLKKRTPSRWLLYLGFTCICIGLWLVSESRMEQLVFSNPYIPWVLAPLSLLLLPLPLLFGVKEYLIKKREKSIAFLLIYIDCAAIASCLILQICGVCDLMILLPVPHTIILVTVVFITYCLIKNPVKNCSQRKKLLWGLLMILVASTELGFYYLGSYDHIGALTSALLLIIFLAAGIDILLSTLRRAERSRILEGQLANQRVLTMASQIKPHFIYNTLGAIYGQIQTNPKVAEELVYNFSKYLRTNIDTVSSVDMILFSQEIQHIKTYARIEEIRFNGRVNVQYDITCEDFLIPPLTIQPLVENAIKHGICQKEDGGTVWIQAAETEDEYVIMITDDGVGFEYHKQENHMGLESVICRLTECVNARFSVDSKLYKGTTITIKIPRKVGDECKELF